MRTTSDPAAIVFFAAADGRCAAGRTRRTTAAIFHMRDTLTLYVSGDNHWLTECLRQAYSPPFL
ncbi:MAG: hypothetical protein N3A66_05390, partial [Planctomycetota bacterium]|nr:hypothetical protein [Planctomycetota bacterium]